MFLMVSTRFIISQINQNGSLIIKKIAAFNGGAIVIENTSYFYSQIINAFVNHQKTKYFSKRQQNFQEKKIILDQV